MALGVLLAYKGPLTPPEKFHSIWGASFLWLFFCLGVGEGGVGGFSPWEPKSYRRFDPQDDDQRTNERSTRVISDVPNSFTDYRVRSPPPPRGKREKKRKEKKRKNPQKANLSLRCGNEARFSKTHGQSVKQKVLEDSGTPPCLRRKTANALALDWGIRFLNMRTSSGTSSSSYFRASVSRSLPIVPLLCCVSRNTPSSSSSSPSPSCSSSSSSCSSSSLSSISSILFLPAFSWIGFERPFVVFNSEFFVSVLKPTYAVWRIRSLTS